MKFELGLSSRSIAASLGVSKGAARAMKLFVAALGASSCVYCQARPSEGLADWIGCHVAMFAAFGGVTAVIVRDGPLDRGRYA